MNKIPKEIEGDPWLENLWQVSSVKLDGLKTNMRVVLELLVSLRKTVNKFEKENSKLKAKNKNLLRRLNEQ